MHYQYAQDDNRSRDHWDVHRNIGLRISASGSAGAVPVSFHGRDLSDAQNERLRPLMRELVKKMGNQTDVGRLVGMGQPAISGFLSGRQGTSYSVAIRVCRLSEVDPREVLGEEVPWKDALEEEPGFTVKERTDMSVATFLLKLDRLPGLREWIESHPATLTVTQLMEGMQHYEFTKPASTNDGVPVGGWGAFFQDALSGRLLGSLPGMKTEAEYLERSQLSPAGKKRLRTAPKKR